MANWRNYKIKNSVKYIIIGIILLVCVFLSGGIIFYHRKKQQNHKNSVTNFSHKQPPTKKISEAEIIEAKKHEEFLKNEVKQLKEQEKELKTQFDNAQSLEEKGKIKKTLTALQKELFDKKKLLKNHAPTSASSQLSKKENIDKKKLADSLKRKIHKKIADLESGKDDIDYEKGINPTQFLFFILLGII